MIGVGLKFPSNIALYNGSRGLKMKYFFYAFYPLHLALLYIVAVLMGLGGVALL